jgi:hypothetical protein
MDYQFWAVIGLILLASAFLLRLLVRGWSRVWKGQCSSGCGCPTKAANDTQNVIQSSALTTRLQRHRSR